MSLLDFRPQAERRTPEQLVEHLKSFSLDLKFSAGIWFFSPSDSRLLRLLTQQEAETLARTLNEYLDDFVEE